jgi:hypothetical protein
MAIDLSLFFRYGLGVSGLLSRPDVPKIFYRLPEDDDPPPDREPLLEDPLDDPEERLEEEDEPLYPDEEPELLPADDPLL